VPPFPGDTPPVIFVPYAIACSEWNVPFFPVKPWQMTRVEALTRMDMAAPDGGVRNMARAAYPPLRVSTSEAARKGDPPVGRFTKLQWWLS
jgi:hypothetical protein